MKKQSGRTIGALVALVGLLLVMGCMPGKGSLSAADKAAMAPYVGVWQDLETLSLTTVVLKADQLQVQSVVDADGENFPVTAQKWDGTVLSWTYHVPSSGYNVRIATTGLDGDILNSTWANDEASGTQEFKRLK
ncbi:MAG: hypothetical protein WC326_15625 [Candidatus Delongbacteria bacterium]